MSSRVRRLRGKPLTTYRLHSIAPPLAAVVNLLFRPPSGAHQRNLITRRIIKNEMTLVVKGIIIRIHFNSPFHSPPASDSSVQLAPRTAAVATVGLVVVMRRTIKNKMTCSG